MLKAPVLQPEGPASTVTEEEGPSRFSFSGFGGPEYEYESSSSSSDGGGDYMGSDSEPETAHEAAAATEAGPKKEKAKKLSKKQQRREERKKRQGGDASDDDAPAPAAAKQPVARRSRPKEAATTSFAELRLSRPLLLAVRDEGYVEPTPIQAMCIPPVLAGRDVLGSCVSLSLSFAMLR